MNRLLAGVLTAAVGASALLASGAIFAGQSQPASIFTAEQADAGRTAYAKHCASCHMPDLSGDNEKPPLSGSAFITTWGGKTTKELLSYLSGAMPYGAPALDQDTYRSITAYILRTNGAIAGSQVLSSDTDVTIRNVTAVSKTK